MADTTADTGRRSTTGDPQQFTTALDDLKQAGCLVLVTGTVDATVRAACSRRLFGSLSHPHQRVIVHPDTTALSLDSYLPNGLTTTSSDVHSITSTQLRGDITVMSDGTPAEGSPAEGTAGPNPSPNRTPYGQQFDTLLAEPTAGPFAPGELRVGILTISELLDRYGQSAARTVLTRVGRQMHARHGIAHCHLPIPSESAVATVLSEHADVHLRLREREGQPPEQCWYLRDADCDSGWLSLTTNS